MKLGINNGVYRDEGFDHLKTLDLAAGRCEQHPDFKVGVVQLYLNPGNLVDNQLLKQVKRNCDGYGLGVITHIHDSQSQYGLVARMGYVL